MAKAAAAGDKAPKDKTPKVGVGSIAREAILAGKTNEETLDIVKKKFPDAKTGMASINWYRNQLRGENPKVKSARELKAAAKPPAAPKGEKAKGAKGDKKADPTA